MQNEPTTTAVSPEALQRKHESRNPPIGRILVAAGIVVAMTVTCFAIIWVTMKGFAKNRPLDASAQARGILVAPNSKMFARFPAPNLQINPHEDLVALRAREETQLQSYGWVDRSNSIVRIPLERAMDLLAQRGLPVRASNAPPHTGASEYDLIRERTQP